MFLFREVGLYSGGNHLFPGMYVGISMRDFSRGGAGGGSSAGIWDDYHLGHLVTYAVFPLHFDVVLLLVLKGVIYTGNVCF